MRLSDYLELNNVKIADFTKKLGLKSRDTVYAYLAGTKMPSRKTMQKIAAETGGNVLPNDFYDLEKLTRKNN